MKKFILNVCLFCLCFFTVFGVLELFFKNITPSDDRYEWQYNEIFNPIVKADIAIMGTSKSMRGINPKLLEEENTSVYNFGLNGSNPEFLFNWYTNYFKKYYPKPRLILLEVSWLMFNENYMWRRIEQDSRYIPIQEFLSQLFYSKDKSTLFFNRFYIFNRTVGYGGLMDSTYRGYTPIPFDLKEIKAYSDSTTFNPKRQRSYFKLLINEFKKDGVNVMFVMLPEKINEDFLEYKYIKENLDYINQEVSKFDYLNYHQEFKTDSIFVDWGHLNTIGARLISLKIKNEIKARTHNNVYTK